jgi:hypothetical protein
VLVGALADGDYDLAQGVTEAHIGFFTRRHVAARSAPAAYVERAAARVQAAKDPGGGHAVTGPDADPATLERALEDRHGLPSGLTTRLATPCPGEAYSDRSHAARSGRRCAAHLGRTSACRPQPPERRIAQPARSAASPSDARCDGSADQDPADIHSFDEPPPLEVAAAMLVRLAGAVELEAPLLPIDAPARQLGFRAVPLEPAESGW